ncbi:MAG: class E sortase [Actinomycetia bacterium]|nr:class E sortase [Actinomycetes bacterium]
MNPRRRALALVAVLLAGCSNTTAVVRQSTVPVAGKASPSTTVHATTTNAPTTTAEVTTTLATTTTAAVPPAAPDTAPAQAKTASLPVPQPPPEPHAPEPSLALGTIEIPRINLNKSLFEGVTLTTLDKGPGHWPGTALPGAMGNVVVGGHRTSKGRPFRHLEKLVPGDEVIFTTDTGRFVYHVVRTEVVTPDAIWIVDQTEAYTATLFACHPVGSTRERIVVFLELSV